MRSVCSTSQGVRVPIGPPGTKLRCTRAADTRRALPSYGVAITLSQPLSVSSKGPSLVITI